LVLALAFGLITPVVLQAQPADVGGMPEELLPELREILRAALDRSPQMISNSLNLAQAEANRYGTDSSLWPSLGGSASYGKSSTSSTTAGVDSSSQSQGLSYSVGLGQPIFQWGALKNRAAIGRIAVKIAERNYAEGYRMLANTIRSQYLSLVGQKASLRYSDHAMQLAETGLLAEEEKLKEGSISEGDLLMPRLGMAEARLSAERARADFASSKRAFARLVGLTELPDERIADEVPLPVHSPETAKELLHAFLRDGPGLTNQGQIYLMYIKQGELNYRIAKTGLYPKFSLNANYGLSFSSGTDASGKVLPQTAVLSKGYGIGGSWTIFDGFATRGAKLSALASKRLSERQLQSYADATVDAAQNSHNQLQFSARALAFSVQRRDLTKANLERVREDFKLGLTSRSSLDLAVAALIGADVSAIQARSDYLNRWADFVSQTGADPAMKNLPARYVRSTK
jgi:outer membrane protein TolC